jgi:hypothetical protein
MLTSRSRKRVVINEVSQNLDRRRECCASHKHDRAARRKSIKLCALPKAQSFIVTDQAKADLRKRKHLAGSNRLAGVDREARSTPYFSRTSEG